MVEVRFTDGFSNAGDRPTHPDLRGEIAAFQIIPTSVANASSLLQRLADASGGDPVLYDHNDFYWNGAWLPQNAIDAQGLGIAQHPGAADEAYSQWVASLLGEIEAGFEAQYARLLQEGHTAESAALLAKIDAARAVQGVQSFIADALIVSQPGGDVVFRPEILPGGSDPFILQSPEAAPQLQLAPGSQYSYDYIRGTAAFQLGFSGSSIIDEPHANPVLTNSFGGLVSILERAQLRGLDFGGLTEADLADKNIFQQLTNQIDGQGVGEYLAMAFLTLSGALSGTFAYEGKLPENIDELRRAIATPGALDNGLFLAAAETYAWLVLSTYFAPQYAAIYGALQTPGELRTTIRILKIYYPEWDFIAEIDEVITNFENFLDEIGGISGFSRSFADYVISGGTLTYEVQKQVAHAVIATDGSVVRASDLNDALFLSGFGEVSGKAGDDVFVFTLPAAGNTPPADGEEAPQPGDMVGLGGAGHDVFLVDGSVSENEAGLVNQVLLDGGEGDDAAYFALSPGGLVLTYYNAAKSTVAGGGGPQLLENIETIIAAQSYADKLYFRSLEIGGDAPAVFDLGGQQSDELDMVSAADLSTGVVVDLRHFDEQFIATPDSFGLVRPAIDHASNEGNFATNAVYNSAVVAQIFWESLTLPDPWYFRDQARISLKNVEAVEGSLGDDFLFGPDDFIKQPEFVEHPIGFRIYNSLPEGEPQAASELPRPVRPEYARISGEWGDDTIVVGSAPTYVDGGEGDDIIFSLQDAGSHLLGSAGDDIIITAGRTKETDFGRVVNGGEGNDTLFVQAPRSDIYGGEGRDMFFWAADTRIMDAQADEAIFFFGLPLTGGIAALGDVEEQETAPQLFFPWVRYGVNIEGDLVIEFMGEYQYVANYRGGPNSAEQTAGIYVATFETEFFRLLEGAKRIFDGEHILVIVREWAKAIGARDPLDPLVLDLDGDGIETTLTTIGAPSFDLDLDGFAERTGWLSGDDGFLVRDLNDNGLIDDISELFGDPQTRGFEALAALDDNGDLRIDAGDAGFAELQVWRDFDGDAQTDPGELFALGELGIVAIDLDFQVVNKTLSTGHDIAAISGFVRADGTRGEISELLFDADDYNTTYAGDATLAPWAAALPDLKGYGLLSDLRVAASNDFRLAAQVQDALDALTVPQLDALRAAFQPVLEAWQQSMPDSRVLTPVLLGETADGAPRVVDYGIYVADSNGGYWTRASGGQIVDGQGNAIVRPGLAEMLAQATAVGESWQLHEMWSQPATQVGEASGREPVAYLLAPTADGGQEIRDFAQQAADGSWLLASGAPVLDAAGAVIAAPTLDDILRQATPEGEVWRVEKFADLGAPLANERVAVAWTDGQVTDYAVFLEGDNVWVSASKLNLAIRSGRDLEAGHKFATLEEFVAWYPSEYAAVERVEIINTADLFYAALVGGLELDDIAPLRASRDADGNLVYGFAHDAQARALQQVIELGEGFQKAAALKFAAQTGLADYFREVPYDFATDRFKAVTDRELKPLFEKIFAAAPADAAGVTQWLGEWRQILDIVYAQFERSTPGPISASFVFANVVAAFESTPINASIYEAAAAMGVPAEDIRFDVREGVSVAGTDGDDLFYLSTGNQVFEGGAGHDAYIVGGNFGQDVILDIEAPLTRKSADLIRFTDVLASDIEAVRDGQDLILSVRGTDNSLRIVRQFEGPLPGLFGGDFSFDTGVAQIVFADGQVWDQTDFALAVRDPQPSDDILFGTTDYDALDGGAGDDYLSGGRESDLYFFDRGYGHDVIEERNDSVLVQDVDMVRFGSGLRLSDLVFSRLGDSDDLLIEIRDNPADSLTIRGQFAAATAPFVGTFWVDRIEMFTFADGASISWDYVIREINARATTDGVDRIIGFDYPDLLSGGAGDDYLSGGNDGDVYLFGRGFGHDVIEDRQTNILLKTPDEVRFSADVSPDDVRFERLGDSLDLTVWIADSDDVLTIRGQFDADWSLFGLLHFDRIETFTFSDGSQVSWSFDYVRRQLLRQASTEGDDEIFGFEAADLLDGGAGNDLLAGGALSDTYLFARGYGHDVIREDAGALLFEDLDRVEFRDLTLADLRISRDGNALVFTITDTGETLTIADQFVWDAGFSRQRFAVEEFAFADGEIKTLADFAADKVALVGTDGADLLQGSDFGEEIRGRAGADLLQGGGGGDRYLYDRGDGADVIHDDAGVDRFPGDDRLVFGAGITPDQVAISRDGADLLLDLGGGDVLRISEQFAAPGTRIEWFEFADGTLWSAANVAERLLVDLASDGNETLQGLDDVPNVLDGRGGDDVLIGGRFADSYLFGPGYGFDRIIEVAAARAEPGALDRVVFATSWGPQDIIWRRDGDDLLASTGAAGDELRIVDGLLGAVELFDFADGGTLTLDDIKVILLAGTDAPDELLGYDDSDDWLDGGAGNDLLRGGDGSDSYLFALGGGQDAIGDTGGGADEVRFGPLIAPEMLRFARDDDTLLIRFAGFEDSLALLDVFARPDNEVEAFRFADGRTLTFDDIRAGMIAQSASDLDDVVVGFTNRDDLLAGGLGNDVLRGGAGSDRYLFAKGDGRDIIEDAAGAADSLLVEGYGADEVQITRLHPERDDLRLSFAGGDDEITILGGLDVAGGAIETIHFADGVVLRLADLEARVLRDAASAGDDLIIGFAGADVLDGGFGDDVLRGGEGGDLYRFARGGGLDVISDRGVLGVDRLEVAGYGLDDLRVHRLSPISDDLVLSFRETSDRILIEAGLATTGGSGIEEVALGDGSLLSREALLARLAVGTPSVANDVLIGGSGPDVLAGLGGSDWLEGRDGSDLYVFRRGDGFDSIEDNGFRDTDRLRIEGYAPAEVRLAREAPGSATLLLRFPDSGDVLRLVNVLDGDAFDGIEEIAFDDGTVWGLEEVRARLVQDARAAGVRFVEGFKGADTLTSGPSDEVLVGRDGADIYVYARGGGRDVIEDAGLFDTDRIEIRGYGPDELRLLRLADTDTLVIDFAGPGDQLIVRDTLGRDILNTVEEIHFEDGTVWDMAAVRARLDTSGQGEQSGGQGDDVYLFSRGDGRVTVRDTSLSGFDVLEIRGYRSDELELSRLDDMLLVHFAGSDDAVQIPDSFGAVPSGRIEALHFDDGTIWGYQEVQARLLALAATDGADLVEGFEGGDVLGGGRGDDHLAGGGGDDVYRYGRGDGHDSIRESGIGTDRVEITGYSPQDVRLLRTGDHLQILFLDAGGKVAGDSLTLLDMLAGGTLGVVEEVAFADGTLWRLPELRQRLLLDAATPGDDLLQGYDSDDLLVGARGNDYLSGGLGTDSYLFRRGDGQDIIFDAGAGETDRLLIEGYSPEEVILRRLHPYSDDLLIRFAGSDDSLVLVEALAAGAFGRVEEIAFADGTLWRVAELGSRLAEGAASAGNDLVLGTDFAETLTGGAGNDVLLGLAGDDVYIFRRGDGRDRIEDAAGSGDVLEIRGYAPDEVRIERAPPDALNLVLRFAGTDDELVLVDTLGPDEAGLERILFEDGTVWTMAELRQRLLTEANDAQARTIHGFASDDVLAGGPGDDLLVGGAGADIYRFARGDGHDVIEDNGEDVGAGAYDRLLISGYAPQEVGLSRWYKGDDGLLLRFAGSDDSVLLRNGLALSGGDRIEEIAFDDGTLWSIDYVESLLNNTVPVARTDSYFAAVPGQQVEIVASRLLQNDFDADGDALRLVAVKNADVGAVTLDADGVVLFAAPDDFIGIAQFTYVAADGRGGLAEGVAYLRVDPRPEARDDGPFVLAEDTAIVLSAAQLLANDRDGDLLRLSDVGAAVGGTVSLRTDGAVVFWPDADFYGAAQFDYQVFGPDGGVDAATVRLEVQPVNDAPVAVDDAGFAVLEDGSLVIGQADLLGNDFDVDGDALRISAVGDAVAGRVTLTAEGDVRFLPLPDFSGAAGFSYTIEDGNGGAASAWAGVEVTPVNDAPVAVDDVGLAASEDSVALFAAADLLANDADADGDVLTITRVFDAEQGRVKLLDNGNIEFLGAEDFFGTASFFYEISDGTGGVDSTAIGRAFVDVAPVNDAPRVTHYLTIFDNAFATDEDVELVIAAERILADAYDVEGDALTLASVSQAENGQVVLGEDGFIRFTPDAEFSGLGGFRYLVSDGQGGISVGQVDVIVHAVNDAPPEARADALSVAEDTTLVIDPQTLLANDSDIDNDPLVITAVSNAGLDTRGAVVSLDADGLIRFTPAADYNGLSRFEYVVSDGTASSTAVVDVTVTPVNDVPQAGDDVAPAAPLGVPVVIAVSDLLANDVDVEGDTLSFAGLLGASGGTVSLYDDRWVVFELPEGAQYPAYFDYQVSDGQGGVDVARVSVPQVLLPVTELFGTQADDLLIGAGWGETITAGAGDDVLHGRDGDDVLAGGPGADLLDGGAGRDTVSYAAATLGVRVDLAARIGQGGDAQGDEYRDIEDIIGSPLDDALLGTAGANLIEGGAGDDELVGRAGSDGYLFAAGHGRDVIREEGDIADTDRIVFADDIAVQDVTLERVGDDLLIRTGPQSDIRVPGHFLSRQSGLEEIAFADGTLWDRSAMLAQLNAPPIAVEDRASGTEDVPLFLDVAALLANDSDPDGDPLQLLSVGDAEQGSVALSGDQIIFRPFADHAGEAGFSYTIGDGNGEQARAWVRVTLAAVNDVPVISEQLVGSLAEDGVLLLEPGTLLANASDVDGDTLRLLAVGDAEHGNVRLRADGRVEFVPEADYFGTASFAFTVDDGNGGQASGRALLTVLAVNDAPEQGGTLAWATGVGSRLELAASDVLGRFVDRDGDRLAIAAVSDAENGAVVLRDDGRVVFTPDAGYRGAAGFTVTVVDGNGAEVTARVAVDVLPQRSGGDGNETLLGLFGADLLVGGAGNDLLLGGLGGDSYVFRVGDGDDTIIEFGFPARFETDRLLLDGVLPEEVTLWRNPAGLRPWDLFVTLNETGETLRVQTHFYRSNFGIEEIVFADGTVLDRAQIAARSEIVAADTPQQFRALREAVAQVHEGDSGDDVLLGQFGADTFVFRPGFGNDRIEGFDTGPDARDVIDVAGLGVTSFEEMVARAYQEVADTVFDFGADGSLTLTDVQLSELDADDFRYA